MLVPLLPLFIRRQSLRFAISCLAYERKLESERWKIETPFKRVPDERLFHLGASSEFNRLRNYCLCLLRITMAEKTICVVVGGWGRKLIRKVSFNFESLRSKDSLWTWKRLKVNWKAVKMLIAWFCAITWKGSMEFGYNPYCDE